MPKAETKPLKRYTRRAGDARDPESLLQCPLAREIMPHDAEVFGNQFPAYRENPMAETLRALQALASNSSYASRYAEFRRDMVYGADIEYAACIETLGELSEWLR